MEQRYVEDKWSRVKITMAVFLKGQEKAVTHDI